MQIKNDTLVFAVMWDGHPVGVFPTKEKAQESLKYTNNEGKIEETRFYE